MKKFIYTALFLSVSLFSCDDSDNTTPVDTNLQEMVAELGEEYNHQVYINLDDDSENNYLQLANTEESYVAFDLTSDPIVAESNNLEGWDIVMTQYMSPVFDGTNYIPYSVTGALINVSGSVMAVAVEDATFSSMDLATAQTLTLTAEHEAIGYSWKVLDFNTFLFNIVPDLYYVIKTDKEEYFKMRFYDFYNESAVKGYPAFEYQRLR